MKAVRNRLSIALIQKKRGASKLEIQVEVKEENIDENMLIK